MKKIIDYFFAALFFTFLAAWIAVFGLKLLLIFVLLAIASRFAYKCWVLTQIA